MSIIELIASFSPLRFVSDWRRENTEREKNHHQMMLEQARIKSTEQQNLRQMELEKQKEQYETIRVLAKEHLLPERAVKELLSLAAGDTSAQRQTK